MSATVSGLLLVDKPAGPTSHDVVARLRRLLGIRRIGHAGTLDPPATGLLPVVIGSATRLVRFLPAEPKEYRGVLRLGLETTTDDATGEVVRTSDGPLPEAEAVRTAARALTGRIRQTPPRVSAKKVGGRRMYDLAREGDERLPEPCLVDVSRFELSPAREPGTWTFLVAVSSGTYVRALARDLGAALGCGGILVELRRTRIGPFCVEDALPPALGREEIEVAVVPVDSMPLALGEVVLAEPGGADRFRAGVAVGAPPGAPEACEVAARDPGGALLGVAVIAGGLVRPRVVLPRA